MKALIHCPHNNDWFEGVRVEAAFQVERWQRSDKGLERGRALEVLADNVGRIRMQFAWLTDDGGDLQLDVDGRYFGMVCPHHLPSHALCVWDGKFTHKKPTIDEAKAYLERIARAKQAANLAFEASMRESNP